MRETYFGRFSHAPQLGNQPGTQARALTGNRTCDLLVPRPVLNPLTHQPGLYHYIFKKCITFIGVTMVKNII